MKTHITPHSLVPAIFVLYLLLACHVAAAPTPRPYAPAIRTRLTLLNDVGKLSGGGSGAEVARWKRQLQRGHLSAGQAARLHLWLGEVEIAQNKEPERALEQFRLAQRLAGPHDPVYGCAAYDRAMTLFFEGAFDLAVPAFHALLRPGRSSGGYPVTCAALWYRHAGACAGYHAKHAKLGITEPPRRDPLCGVASLAACMRANNRPYDRKTLLSHCRMTGLGNSMQDLLDGAKRLGMSARVVKADSEGLKALPMPVVAYVELDHFVAVTRADAQGVSYLCSDCGAWPGGRRDLTWQQWRAMDCNLFLVVARSGSPEDGALRRFSLSDHSRRPAPAERGPQLVAYCPSSSVAGARPTLFTRILGTHIVLLDGPCSIACGDPPTSCECTGEANCSSDGACGGSGGSSGGDPVDLATGEEHYHPEADLTVYNPIGPNVVWRHCYGSMHGPYTPFTYTYNQYAFGNGWSNDYDYQAVVIAGNPSPSVNLYDPRGGAYAFTIPATPTASNPQVSCTASSAGTPMLCTYNYNSDGSLSFIFLKTDRSQWVFSSLNGYALTRIVDRNGNFINFVYTPLAAAGYELSSITDSNNQPLLMIRHNSRSNIVSVSDRYSRSVTYEVQRFPNFGVPNLYSQFSDELVQVSQVVREGTVNPPSRYRYGYQYNWNGDAPSERIPTLHTITAPSPTGRGVSTATINYNGFYVKSLTDANGNTRSYGAIDANDTRVTITNSKHHVIYSYTVGFDSQMRTTYRTDGTNAIQVYQAAYLPDNANQPATVTNANNQTTSYTYDPFGQITSMTSPRNVTTTTTWNYSVFPLGERTQVQVGAKSPTSFTYYEPSGLPKNVTLPAPGTVGSTEAITESFAFDALGNVLTATRAGNDTTPTITTTFNYTQDGAYSQPEALWQPLTITDNLGHVTHRRYDAQGNLTASIDALGNETDTAFNIANQQTRMLAPAIGDITNQLRVTRSKLTYAPITKTYNGTLTLTNMGSQSLQGSLLLALTNMAPGITLANATGNYVNSPALLSPTVNLAPGAATIVNVSFAAPSANAVSYGVQTYLTDSNGNPLALPSETRSIYLYPGGPLVSVNTYDETGALYRQVRYALGKEGELLSVSGSAEPVTYTYDGAYRRLTLVGGNGSTTYFAYNTAGWLQSVNFPQGDSVQYPSYDPMGNVLKRIDGRGIETDYTYNDPESKLTDIAYVNNASYPNVSQYNVGIDYDGYGRQQDVIDYSGHQHFDYDDLDDQTEIDTTYTAANGSALPTVTLTYAFNPDGTRHMMSVQTTTTSYSYVYGYDGTGRQQSLTNPLNETTQWSYLNNNWVAAQGDANGVLRQYAYNRRGFVNDITHTAPNGTLLSDFGAMVYDVTGNRLSQSVTIPSASAAYNGQTGYAYDSRDQLTGEQSTLLGGYTENFSYDPADNPLVFKGRSNAFNADNQFTNTDFSYDGEGNPTTYAGTSLTFDPENHMTSFGTTLTAGYRMDGQRAWKQTASGRTYYIYDLILPIIEIDGTGNVTAINTFGMKGLISRNTSAGSTFYAFDPQGSVAQRLNASVASLSTSAYDAFGAGMSTSSPSDPFSYDAQWSYVTDNETAMMLLSHRYYDPGSGRFLTRDPTHYRGGVNLYAYVHNNVTYALDPLGYGVNTCDVVCGLVTTTISTIICAAATLALGITTFGAGLAFGAVCAAVTGTASLWVCGGDAGCPHPSPPGPSCGGSPPGGPPPGGPPPGGAPPGGAPPNGTCDSAGCMWVGPITVGGE